MDFNNKGEILFPKFYMPYQTFNYGDNCCHASHQWYAVSEHPQ